VDSATSADGTDVRCYVQGSGPAVLIVGPGLDDGTRTKRLSGVLAARFRVLRLRRRQYRLDLKTATGATGAAYPVAQEVDDVLTVARAIGPPVILYGHSSGGVVALEALVAAPTAFAGAVIFEPAAALDEPLAGERGEVVTRGRAAIAVGRPGKAMAIFFARSVGLPRWQARLAATATALIPHYRRLVSCQIDDLEAMDRLGHRRSAYARITVPTVLLGGDRSPARISARLGALDRRMPGAQRVVLHNRDHGADRKAPEEVARVIAAHADAVLSPRAGGRD
jgi:pimeloyl-ACP methyl ester carboxylesterase